MPHYLSKMKKLIIIAFLILLSRLSFAQRDFIVTIANDTIYGRITSKAWSEEVKIKPNKKKDISKMIYTADNLKCYSKEREVYESLPREQPREGKVPVRIFAKKTMDGALSLYEYKFMQSGTAYGTSGP